MPQRAAFFVLLVLLIAGCGTSAPKLNPVGKAVPENVSFAGKWVLRDDPEATLVVGRPAGTMRRSQSKKAPTVHVFLETGRNLKVTQTEHALFISFDRSVVEEYRFREHRQVSVGPVEAERVSGWDGKRYVILTLDRQGALLTETWEVAESGRRLLRTVRIVHAEKEVYWLHQEFDRDDS